MKESYREGVANLEKQARVTPACPLIFSRVSLQPPRQLTLADGLLSERILH
jgi:hypothetical protein